jgi:sigma-B regulation protein RsbU (phosphoserine phosphatase)
LYYNHQKDETVYLSIDGMGLGMLRNKLYEKYVHEKAFQFGSGDVMVLITDGIVEAKDGNGIEFGYDRLREVVHENVNLDSREIQDTVIREVYKFIGKNKIADDDYSLMVVKFK